MRAGIVQRAIPAISLPLVLTMAMPAAQAAKAGPASPAGTGTQWRAVATVTVRSADVIMVSAASARPGRAWAVGIAFGRRSNVVHPVIESWNGTVWSRVRLPAGLVRKLGVPVLVTATASRRSGLWAFTLGGGWLHFDGTTWAAGRLPHRRFVQASLAAGGAVWAFGGVSEVARGNVPFAAYLTASGRWKPTVVPGKGVIADASAVSGHDVWAVIGRGLFGAAASASRSGALVHWSGARWETVPGLPAVLRNSSLSAVLARSDRDVWVGGATRNGANGTTEAVGHWNGRRWTVTRLRAPAAATPFRVAGFAPDGFGGIWALGVCTGLGCPQAGTTSRLWHQTRGRWTGPTRFVLASGARSVLFHLTSVGRSVWGVGGVIARDGNANGLIALWGPVP